MKLPQILSGVSESWQAAEKVLESTKTSAVVSSYTFVIGFLSAAFDWFKEGLPFMSMLAAFVTALLAIRARLRLDKREEIETDTAHWNNRKIREEVRLMGVEIREEDRK